MLAARSRHRVAGVVDLLTASAGEFHRAVLHYDSDFDSIAAVTGQDVRWVAARGSAG